MEHRQVQVFKRLTLKGDVDDNSLREELETCKRFLVDSEMENGRERV